MSAILRELFLPNLGEALANHNESRTDPGHESAVFRLLEFAAACTPLDMDQGPASPSINRTNITLLEPQRTGLQHVPFNASLLSSVSSGGPGCQPGFQRGVAPCQKRSRQALGGVNFSQDHLAAGIRWNCPGKSFTDLPRLWMEAYLAEPILQQRKG